MNNLTKKRLLSDVTLISRVAYCEKKIRADFHVKGDTGFTGEISENQYVFTPIQQDKVPEIKRIIWKRFRTNLGPSIQTDVIYTDNCPPTDRAKYLKILSPKKVEIHGVQCLYPYEFKYVPLLEHATQICKAWRELQNFTQKVKLARHNLKDVIALKKASFDLREYC